MTAALLVEQRGEDARRVEPRGAEPVDRAVGRDQRGSLQISDQAVVLYRWIRVHVRLPRDGFMLGGSLSSQHAQLAPATPYISPRLRQRLTASRVPLPTLFALQGAPVVTAGFCP